MLPAEDSEPLDVNAKCCAHCAFRRHSSERSDAVGWRGLVDDIVLGNGVFLCHESVPGHSMERIDTTTSRYRVCAGFIAMRQAPGGAIMRHVGETDQVKAIAANGLDYVRHVLSGDPEPEIPDAIKRRLAWHRLVET